MLLESSESGLAFAWRSEVLPAAGTLIELLDTQAGPELTRERGIIRRALSCHDNLNVLAVERIDLRPFPLTTAAVATPHQRIEDELKPFAASGSKAECFPVRERTTAAA